MNNLNDSLPDLMRRATENLEPESTDLVERGMRRGTTLRRRRTALLSLSAAGAVLATAGIVVGGTQLFGSPQDKQAPVAGTPTNAASTAATTKPATAADTLATLRKLVPAGLQQSKPGTWGGGKDEGFNGASLLLNDGKGASQVTVAVSTNSPMLSCQGWEGYCKVRPDGSFLITINERKDNREPNSPKPLIDNSVEIHWKNGRSISVSSYNSLEEKSAAGRTRPKPILSVATLLKMAESDQWGFPAKPALTDAPATPKPPTNPVPLAETLATLKKVLPGSPQLTRPTTWGGGQEGDNGASYVVNDGNGAAGVNVMVTTSSPITSCQDEGLAHCKVRADGSVLSWTKEEPSYSDGRQAVNGVTGNFIQLSYPDGRLISMIAFNGPSEKNDKHTRAKPIYTVEQLTTMAASKLWKFPGGSVKPSTK